MKIVFLFLIFSVFLAPNILAQQDTVISYEKYAPPKELKAFLDTLFNKNQISSEDIKNRTHLSDKLEQTGFKKLIMEGEDKKFFFLLPHPFDNYLLKTDPSRVILAGKMRHLIAQKNYKRLYIPRKFLYKIPSYMSGLLNNNYWVIVEKISYENKESLVKTFNTMPDKDIFQLLEFVKETDFIGLSCSIDELGRFFIFQDPNICLNKQGQIVFIDTDQTSVFRIDHCDDQKLVEIIFNSLMYARFSAPQELVLVYILLSSQGFELIQKGREMYKTLFVTYQSIMPFLAISRHKARIIMPFVLEAVEQVHNLTQEIFTQYPDIQEKYYYLASKFQHYFGDCYHNKINFMPEGSFLGYKKYYTKTAAKALFRGKALLCGSFGSNVSIPSKYKGKYPLSNFQRTIKGRFKSHFYYTFAELVENYWRKTYC